MPKKTKKMRADSAETRIKTLHQPMRLRYALQLANDTFLLTCRVKGYCRLVTEER